MAIHRITQMKEEIKFKTKRKYSKTSNFTWGRHSIGTIKPKWTWLFFGAFRSEHAFVHFLFRSSDYICLLSRKVLGLYLRSPSYVQKMIVYKRMTIFVSETIIKIWWTRAWLFVEPYSLLYWLQHSYSVFWAINGAA